MGWRKEKLEASETIVRMLEQKETHEGWMELAREHHVTSHCRDSIMET